MKINMSGYPIYLDYNATTPCDPQVVEACIAVMRENDLKLPQI